MFMKLGWVCFLSLGLLGSSQLKAQDIIEWSPEYKLEWSDFKLGGIRPAATVYRLNAGIKIDFLFNMSGYEFTFTKNFNSKATTTFSPWASELTAPDSVTAQQMLNFARYEFDLGELYTRKFRKRLFETKNAASDTRFYIPVYEEITREHAERLGKANEQADMGRAEAATRLLHDEVLKEITELADFCKTCKPSKKKAAEKS